MTTLLASSTLQADSCMALWLVSACLATKMVIKIEVVVFTQRGLFVEGHHSIQFCQPQSVEDYRSHLLCAHLCTAVIIMSNTYVATLHVEPSTGFIGEGFVILSCEVSGYTSSSSPPMWAADSGANLTDPAKFAIDFRSGDSNSLIYPNGSVGPGVVSTLTINQLSAEDGGGYTCSFGGRTLVSQLTIMGGTSPAATDATGELPADTTVGGGPIGASGKGT